MKKSLIFILTLFWVFQNEQISIIDNRDVPKYKSAFIAGGSGEVVVGPEKNNFESDDIAIAGAAIDKNNNLFYLTYSQIYKIGPDTRTIIKKRFKIGQGPGEFEHNPSYILCDPNGNIYVYDGYKIISFDNDLKFIKNIQVRLLPGYNFMVDKNEYICAMNAHMQSNKAVYFLAFYNKEGAIIREISSDIQTRPIDLGGITLFSEHAYTLKAYYCLDPEGNLYLARNDRYQIT